MKAKITQIKSFGILLLPLKEDQDINSLDINLLRELVWSERLIILRGFKTFGTAEDLSQYCERWGKISLWPFGKVLELIERQDPEDHIFNNGEVPLHWDGMYREEVPEFQIFHCAKAPTIDQRGRTIFSNTIKVLENASSLERSLWEKVTGSYERKMEFYHSKTIAPVVETHPLRGYPVIRYNGTPRDGMDDFLNPPKIEFSGVSKDLLQDFHQSLNQALYSPINFYAHQWQINDVVIADNFSLLHGRESFETKAPRHLRRVHVLSNPPLNNPHLVFHR